MVVLIISCVNDPYDAANSTKDDERDLRAQGKAHIPNTYMKLDDPFPSARALTTLLCSVSNKGRLHKLICSYRTDIAQTVDAEIVYSVGSHCTNLSTQQPMQNYCFYQSEADTILFSTYSTSQKFGHTFNFFEKCFLYFYYFLHCRFILKTFKL